MKDNKLIAEFMGVDRGMSQMQPPYELNTVEDGLIFIDEAKYHSSWDWLMPVVEKIENMKYHIIIDRVKCEIYSSLLNKNFKKIYRGIYNNSSKITNVYEAVIEFIKWYKGRNQ